MELKVRVIAYHGVGEDVALPPPVTFDSEGGSIGRAAESRLHIPDPELFVSSHHADVTCDGQTFFITDRSTNGLDVNGQRARRDERIALADGDSIDVGDFQLCVEVNRDAPFGAGAGSGLNAAGQADPFGGTPSVGPVASGWPGDTRDTVDLPASEQVFGTSHFDDVPSSGEVPDVLDLYTRPSPPGGSDQGAPAADAGDSPLIGDEWDHTHFEPPAPKPRPQRDQATESRPDRDAQAGEAAVTAREPATAPVGGSAAALHHLLQAAGMDPQAMHVADPERALAVLGLLTRASLECFIELLRARTDFKELIRAGRTRAWDSSNPLKDNNITPQEALAELLSPNAEAADFIAETATDLKLHQVAMIAGVQGLAESLLRRVSPEEAERSCGGNTGLTGLLAGTRKASCWDAYLELHAALAEEVDGGMDSLLRNAFMSAYERRIMEARQVQLDAGASRGDTRGHVDQAHEES